MTLHALRVTLLVVGLGAAVAAVGCATGVEAIPAPATGGAPGAGGGATPTGGRAGSGGVGGPTGSGGASVGSSGGAGVGSGGASLGSGGATGATGSGGRPGVTPARLALPWMDDFEGNAVGGSVRGWIQDPEDEVGKWMVVADGATKVLQETVAVSSISMMVGGDVGWTDQKVDARVKIATASSGVLAILATRFVDFDNYYFLHLKGDGSIKIRKRIMGSTTDLVTFKSGTALAAGTWYSVGFGFKGTTVTAYLNGTAVGTMTEVAASHPAGGIALGVQDGAATFDDVKVTAP